MRKTHILLVITIFFGVISCDNGTDVFPGGIDEVIEETDEEIEETDEVIEQTDEVNEETDEVNEETDEVNEETDDAIDGEDGTDEADRPMEKKVLTFYYPWYGTPDHSGHWIHWGNDQHNPDNLIDEEMTRRDITSSHYPTIGVYDSMDPDLIDLHIEQSVAAGIDAWIVSWWGMDHDVKIQTIMNRIVALDSPLRIVVLYEQIIGCSNDLCLNLKNAEKFTSAKESILHLVELGAHPAWMKVDGKPVLFVYDRPIIQGGRSIWKKIIEQVKSTHDVFITGDASYTFNTVPAGFDQMYLYSPAFQWKLFGDPSPHYGSFCDKARALGISCALPVLPGHDGTWWEYSIPFMLDREDGALYRRFWDTVTEADADWILITSFNEWHEGTEIEPSREYGDRYLTLTKELSDLFK